MSGFEVIGVILALYPLVQDALKTYRGVTSGRFIESLQKDVATEELIFLDFLHAILLPVLPKAVLLRLIDASSGRLSSQNPPAEPSSPYTLSSHEGGRRYLRPETPPSEVSWRDVQASLERVFTPRKAQLILETLGEIQAHLHAIQTDVSASSTGSVSDEAHFFARTNH